MAQVESIHPLDPAQSGPGGLPDDKAAAPVNGTVLCYSQPPAYLDESLQDAERLLRYASELGIPVDDDVRDSILQARATTSTGWNEPTAARVLTALAKLAAQIKPVTAESLRACISGSRAAVRQYWAIAVCLAIIIVPFSLASFIATGLTNSVKTDIATANDLAVKLRTRLGAPPASAAANGSQPAINPNDVGVITELQQFAAAIRSIDARSRQLNTLVFHAEKDPLAAIRNNPKAIHDEFQLPEGLPDLSAAANKMTTKYQDVRYFAQSVLDDVYFFYGAFTACLLPVLYALLGTCAFLLRAFEQQMGTRTYIPSSANSARFLIAGIGGGVVGLFNNFTLGQAVSLPPLALAFLVGYAVDVFFAFLEGILQGFTRPGANPNPQAPASRKT